MHSSQDEVPLRLWYEPGLHAVQFAAPGVSDTRPASHAVHDELPLISANVPSVQFMHSVDAVKLYLPTAQSMQELARFESLVLPASQFLQLELPFVLA